MFSHSVKVKPDIQSIQLPQYIQSLYKDFAQMIQVGPQIHVLLKDNQIMTYNTRDNSIEFRRFKESDEITENMLKTFKMVMHFKD